MLTSPPASLSGATDPRVEVAPPYAYSVGAEAIELARRAGLYLEEWQQRALNLMLGVRKDGQWACFEYAEIVARQNGKGAILEARALAGLFLLGERTIMWTAHRIDTVDNAFERLRTLLETLGEQQDNNNVIYVGDIPIQTWNGFGQQRLKRMDTGQQVRFATRSKGGSRGLSGDLVIIDEALEYTYVQQDAMMPTTLARPNPQILYTSSPPYDGDSGEVLYQVRKRALDGDDGALGYRDWGVEGDLDNLDKIDLDDRRLWAASNPALGTRMTEERIAMLRRSMADEGFAREILSVWPKEKTGGGAIDVAQWADLVDAMSKRAGDFALGVDITPDRSYSAIALYGLRDDELGHGQLVNYHPGTDWIIPRLRELAQLDPVAIGMGRGTAASLKTALEVEGITVPEDHDKPERGDLAVIGGTDMSAACGQLIDAVKQAIMRHLGQHPLDVSVAGAHTKETGDSIAWSRKDAETDTCPVVSLTVAKRAFEDRVEQVKKKKRTPMAAWA